MSGLFSVISWAASGAIGLLQSGFGLASRAWARVFSTRRARLILLGLDNSGKTTLLQLLKKDVIQAHEPTQHPQSDEITMHGINFQAFDLGGHTAARTLWRRYYPGMDGVVFMVDAADRDRFAEACTQLGQVLDCDELLRIPIVILGNKIDARGAVSEDELARMLGLDAILSKYQGAPVSGAGPRQRIHNPELRPGSEEDERVNRGTDAIGRPIRIFMCSLVRRTGYHEALAWLAQNLPKPP